MHSTRLVALTIATLLFFSASRTGTASAADQPTPGEQALKYRKSLYQVIVWNFGPMSAMAQGKIPFDQAEFATRASRVAALTPLLPEAYPPESRGVAGSDLKDKMWDNRADFNSKLQDLINESAKLASVAQAGDEADSKAAFFDTANACKNCHDEYRSDD